MSFVEVALFAFVALSFDIVRTNVAFIACEILAVAEIGTRKISSQYSEGVNLASVKLELMVLAPN